MTVPARIPALVLCLAICGCAFTGSRHAVAFTTAAVFKTPTYCAKLTAAAGGVEPHQQRTCRRRARPSPAWRRRLSPSAGGVRLSAAEGEDEESDESAGVYVATEVSENNEDQQEQQQHGA